MTKPLSRRWKDFVRFRYESGRNGIFYSLDRPSRRQSAHFVQNPLVIAGWAVDVVHRTAPRVRIVLADRTYHPAPRLREDVQRTFEATAALPSACGFEEIIDLPVGVHRLKVEIDAGGGAWLTLYSALVFNLPFHRSQQAVTSSYRRWAKMEQALLAEEIPELRKHCATMLRKPKFSVIIEATSPADFQATADSLNRQIYPHWTIHALVPQGVAAPRALPASAKVIHDIAAPEIEGDFLVFGRAGDELAANALYEFASALNADPGLDMIYADESHAAGRSSRSEPFIKPDWSPDYLETFNYVGHPACFRISLARACAPNAGYYDFVLRFTELTGKIHHVRRMLLHRPGGHASVNRAQRGADLSALAGRLQRTGRAGTVRPGAVEGCYELVVDIKERPLVSIIIPTAGRTVDFEGRRIDLVVNCVSQVLERSTYGNKEIIIVDNGDLAPEKRHALEQLGCRLITFAEPTLNIPKKLNLGASIAQGSMLLLLNDDIEQMAPDWIERMLEQFEKRHVGVAGAKLLYPNGLLQHAGVVHNKGNPTHVRRLYSRDDAGYFFSTCGVRNFVAVTGACMMTPREIYRRVGGYSEELPVSYNDIDYCMKVGELGLYTVYVPRAEMIHLESQSRQATLDAREVDWYQRRWAQAATSDPFYNERLLTVGSPTFEPCVNRRLI